MKQENFEGVANTYNNIGACAQSFEKYDSAVYYYKKAKGTFENRIALKKDGILQMDHLALTENAFIFLVVIQDMSVKYSWEELMEIR